MFTAHIKVVAHGHEFRINLSVRESRWCGNTQIGYHRTQNSAIISVLSLVARPKGRRQNSDVNRGVEVQKFNDHSKRFSDSMIQSSNKGT